MNDMTDALQQIRDQLYVATLGWPAAREDVEKLLRVATQSEDIADIAERALRARHLMEHTEGPVERCTDAYYHESWQGIVSFRAALAALAPQPADGGRE